MDKLARTVQHPGRAAAGAGNVANYLKRFWAVFGSLAGVVGLYLGAVQVKLTVAFWVVVAISAFVALVSIGGKWLFEAHAKLRTYPRLLERAAQLETEVEALSDALDASKDEREAALEAGITEGRAQIRGAILSSMTEPPLLTLLGRFQEVFVLIAKYESSRPYPRSRYLVVGSETGEVKGSVEVVHVDDTKKNVFLKCVDAQNSEFWEHLASRQGYDASPPVGVELARYDTSDVAVTNAGANLRPTAKGLEVQG
ncbi:hypothetical protein ABZU42_12665 [Micromonospora profundi]|uniref:hypothetical protein n=1 Tax=Micromonospora profundi TaxID=1420889 RepID=UPI0033B0DE41